MKVESPGYTSVEMQRFIDDFVDHDRRQLVARFEKASARLQELGAKIKPGGGSDTWSAHEILAHIAVLSKFYGVLVHRISSGQLTEMNLLENVNLRDVAGEQMAQLDPADLLRMIRSDHERTLEALRSVAPEALRRVARLEDGTSMSAEDVARLPLVNHLELHVEQLEKALGA